MTTAPPSGPANTVGSQRQDHPQHQVTGRREPGARGAIEAGTAARTVLAVARWDPGRCRGRSSTAGIGSWRGTWRRPRPFRTERSALSSAGPSRTAWCPESPRAWPASSAWRRRARRRRRVAEPDLDFREFCRRSKLPLLRPRTLERTWDAWQAGRYQRGEISPRPGYTGNPLRPR
jgi:hypothetical protein